MPARSPHSSGSLPVIALACLAGAVPAGAQHPRRARAPEAVPAPLDSGDVRLCAGGDVTLGSNLPTFVTRPPTAVPVLRRHASAAERRAHARALAAALVPRVDTVASPWRANPARLVAPLAPLLRDADVVLVNVEGAIGVGPADSKCGPASTMCFAFRMDTAAASALRALAPQGAVVGNVANNHARDAGAVGLDSTVAALARAGAVATGADTLASVAVSARGDTVAFLGFATSGPGTPDLRDLDAVRRHVARAAARWPRLVVTMHAGSEGAAAQRTRDTTESLAGQGRGNPVAFARAAVGAGADLVVGHGPHVLRAGEWQGDVPVLYSLGNLVTYGPFVNRPPLDRGALLCATLGPDGRARDLALRATRQLAPGRVRRDAARRAYVLVDSLSRLDFPATAMRVRRDGRIAPPPAASASRR